MVLGSTLYGGGGGKNILIPNGSPTLSPTNIPLNLIDSNSDFTSSGDFTLDTVFNYYNDFTIAAGHQMTIPANSLRIIYASGTITIGGNGITAGTTSAGGSSAVLPGHWPFIQDFSSTGGVGTGTDGGDATGFGAGGGGGYSGSPAGANGGDSYIVGVAEASGSAGGGGAGAGGASNGTDAGGAAGASKLITLIIVANEIIITGNISLAGGAGGIGTRSAGSDGPGGGGGGLGGNLLCFSNNLTHSSGIVSVSGGAGGGSTTGDPGGGGGGGGGGHSGVFYWQSGVVTLSGGTRAAAAGAAGSGSSGAGGEDNGGDGSAGYSQTVKIVTGNPF